MERIFTALYSNHLAKLLDYMMSIHLSFLSNIYYVMSIGLIRGVNNM